jgi:hypothetical protein
LHIYIGQSSLQFFSIEFEDEVEGEWNSEAEGVDEDDCFPDELQLKKVLVPSLSRAEHGEEVVGEVSNEAQQHDQSGQYPKGAVEVGVGLRRIDELLLMGEGHRVGDALDDFLFAYLKVLFIVCDFDEPCPPGWDLFFLHCVGFVLVQPALSSQVMVDVLLSLAMVRLAVHAALGAGSDASQLVK